MQDQSTQISKTKKHFRDYAKQLMLPALPSKPLSEATKGKKPTSQSSSYC